MQTVKRDLLDLLECPRCGGSFQALPEPMNGGLDRIVCSGCAEAVEVRGSIPRFVRSDQYVKSFSFEWTRFRTTQMDSHQADPESLRRFQQSLDEPIGNLKGKRVLDAGCGAGRFAEVALEAGARVVGVDLSYAIDAAHQNLSNWESLSLIQADLMDLPLKAGSFDLVYSLGVLHHTPDAKRAFLKLVRFLKAGGKISITLYAGYNKVYVKAAEGWRKLTTRLPHRVVYGISTLAVPLYPLYRLPVVGLIGQALFPISMHPKARWRVLDTFDCYTPRYQSYHTHPEVFQWFQEAGLTDVKVLEPGISMIGTRR
ncbi:MAG: class I SAM-dependent methyltransferase [Candidatus Omnitrophica bacterium]|nr:class I SAM-dependent methyltransferase [Candidatus Omnitrophota bacterium]